MQNIVKKLRLKIKGQIFLICEKFIFGFCIKGKIYLLLFIIYIFIKVFGKDFLYIKGIKNFYFYSL